MNIEDFKVGEYFYTASGKWLCLDKGTRSIIAACVRDQLVHTIDVWASINTIDGHPEEVKEESRKILKFENIKRPWEQCNLVVFADYDFGGCSLVPFPKENQEDTYKKHLREIAGMPDEFDLNHVRAVARRGLNGL